MGNKNFVRALFIPLGALVCWLFKGFKGGYFDQDTDENEGRNITVGIITMIIVVIAVGIFKN